MDVDVLIADQDVKLATLYSHFRADHGFSAETATCGPDPAACKGSHRRCGCTSARNRSTQPSGAYRILMGFFFGETRLKIISGPNDGDNRARLGGITVN